jgi:3-methyl-2-oxobutanoate hydroxymethyltransferase
MVWQDMAGLRGGKLPRFVKQYADMRTVLADAVEHYADEVRTGQFPTDAHSFE